MLCWSLMHTILIQERVFTYYIVLIEEVIRSY